MFELPTETGARIEQALAQRICTAADGSYIRFSGGRSKAGRPSKYSVHMADGTFFTVRAISDNQAAELANKKVGKHG